MTANGFIRGVKNSGRFPILTLWILMSWNTPLPSTSRLWGLVGQFPTSEYFLSHIRNVSYTRHLYKTHTSPKTCGHELHTGNFLLQKSQPNHDFPFTRGLSLLELSLSNCPEIAQFTSFSSRSHKPIHLGPNSLKKGT